MKSKGHMWIFLAALALVLVAYALVVHAPQGRRLARLQSELADCQVQLQQDRTRAQRIPHLAAEVDRLKRHDEDFDRRLPGRQELGEFLREIAHTAESGRLVDQVIQPGSPTSGPLFNRLPILMDFTCTFSQLDQFLQKMEEMTRLTRVERIAVEPVAGEPGMLRVNMQVNIYFTES